MSKFGGSSAVQAAQQGNLGNLELPTQVLPEQEQAPAPAQPSAQPAAGQGTLLDELAAQPSEAPLSPEAEAQAGVDVQAAVGDSVPGLLEEQERQRIPSLNERAQGGARQDRWLQTPVAPIKRPNPTIDSQSAGAGMLDRSRAMAENLMSGNMGPILSANSVGAETHAAYKEGKSGPEVAEIIASEKEGTLIGALERAGAIVKNPNGHMVPDPRYTSLASVVTENAMAQAILGEGGDAEYDPVSAAIGEDDSSLVNAQGKPRAVTHAEGNAGIGQQIHQEWQRVQGNPEPGKLPTKEAETLGASFKELWAAQNDKLVTKAIDPATNQYVYQLSALGEAVINNGAEERKRLFPKKHVKPAKQPLENSQLPGDTGANAVKRASGKVGKQKFGRVIEDAMTNLGKVPNIVDKQRAKILFTTVLPVLKSGDHNNWMAEINNFGPGKIKKFDAAAKQQLKKKQEVEATGQKFNEDLYDPAANLAAIADKIAQEVQSVAAERNGANYLSYNVQGFQGRITPQQSFFNPTTSKAVRFVTRNAVPSIAKKGSRIDKNLRQMYAMMLVKDADSALPTQRDIKLDAAAPQLEAWGDRLTEVLDQSMTDDQYEAVSQAMEQGIALNDPAFPQFNALALDPTADAELISKIESKGEDGPHFIDGLIDFAKYNKARRAGKPHSSYFNAYIDGKTNGIASNAIQMGNIALAERTGVLRDSRVELLDDGDVRAQLKDMAINAIDEGWEGVGDDYIADMNRVAEEVYSYRDLNKKTTMTFGYGKEIDSFVTDFEEALAFLGETTDESSTYRTSLASLDKNMSRNEIAQALMNKYGGALVQVMSADALETRSLMRGAAALHSATNTLFSFKGPTGMDMNLGGDVTTGYEGADITRQKFKKDGKTEVRNIAHYNSEVSSVAGRSRVNEETGQTEVTPGEKAYGGSVVAPVQALDAATVALSAAGKSWDRMQRASGGNAYMHTIYDAFKLDANGFDVALEEINKNWLDTSMEWNYLEAARESTAQTMKDWNDKMKARDPKEAVSDNERAYMDFIMAHTIKNDNPGFHNFRRKMPKFKSYPEAKDQRWKAIEADAKGIAQKLAHVGYDVTKPPETVTVEQLRTFVNAFAGTLQLGSKMAGKVNKIEGNKKKLKSEILKRAYKTERGERIALQYYAH